MKTDVGDASVSDTLYPLPGGGGEITTGLGQGLLDRGFQLLGAKHAAIL